MSKYCEENQNGLCPEWMSNSLREIQKQKEGANHMDELERKSYECAKHDVVKLIAQNEDLRKQISALKSSLEEQKQEIRNRNEQGDVLVRMIQKLTSGEAAEIQVTIRTKRYFEE